MTYDTDKYELGLMAEYEGFFAARFAPPGARITIMEIGVLRGGFLAYLLDRFPMAHVIGLDRVLPDMSNPRLTLIRADQNDESKLREIGNRHGPLQLVIDDASHRPAPTRRTFNALWPAVAPGGWYVIEDWIVGFWADPAQRGMERLVLELIVEKPRIGASEIYVLLREPRCSLAAFRKA